MWFFVGLIEAIQAYLETHLSPTRAAKIDALDADITTRAPAATALTDATWTNAKAAHIDADITSRASQASVDTVDAKVSAIESGIDWATKAPEAALASTSSGSYVTVVSVADSGYLQSVWQRTTTSASGNGSLRITIDAGEATEKIITLADITASDSPAFSLSLTYRFAHSLLVEHFASGPTIQTAAAYVVD